MFLRRTTPRSVLRRLRIRLLPVPGQALGLVVLVAVLTAALISAPLMVASAEQAAWEQQRARLSEGILGTTLVSATAMGGPAAFARLGRAAELDAAVSEAAAAADLSAPVPFASLRDDLVAYGPSGVGLAQLIHRTDASSHVEIVAGAPSDDGVLVPAALAESAGLRPGDLVALASEDGAETQVPVSGVYTTPTAPLDPYWEGKGYLFLPFPDPTTGDLVTPPPVLLGSPDVVYAAASAVRVNLNLEWQFPLPEATGVADARATAADMERLQVAISDPESAVSRVVGEYDFAYPAPITALPEVLTTVDKTVELLSPPVRAVGIGGAAAALVLVGAWAGLRIRGRDDEVRSLVARGLSPLRGAGQAVREALLPVLIGSVVGAAAGWLLVRELGPAAELPPSALPRSLTLLAAGALAVLAVVAVVTGVLVARVDSVGRGPAAQLLGRIPWLAVTAAVAVVAAVPLVTAEPDAAGTGFGVLTLVAPLLVTVVVAGAVTAVLPRIGRRADARLRRLPPGAFLAVRRVLAGQGAARLVVVTTALSLGLVVYAGALTDSTARTVEAKAAVATGSDVVVPLVRSRAADGPLPDGAMVVATDSDAGLLPGDLDVDVVAVTPEDVAGVVRWNERLAEQPLGDLMAALAGYEGDRVPVVLAGPVPDAVLEATGGELTLDFRYYTLPVQVVGRADAFPGQGSRDPLLVADWDRYLAGLETANRDPGLVLTLEVWARGTAPAVVQSLVEAGFTPDHLEDVTTSAAFADRPELRAQTWSLAYLRAVALAAGVLGLVGVAMHAVSQQRRRTSAGLLLSRMGMSRRSADAAAGLEIGLLTGLSALVAVLVALPASTWVLRLLDPVPSLQPDALFAVPWSSIGAVVLGVVLVTVGGAVLVGRAARRATGGQVMRDAS